MFAESKNILILSLKDNDKNKNTQQSTNNWINGPIGFLQAEHVNPVRQIKTNCQLFVWNFCTYIINRYSHDFSHAIWNK